MLLAAPSGPEPGSAFWGRRRRRPRWLARCPRTPTARAFGARSVAARWAPGGFGSALRCVWGEAGSGGSGRVRLGVAVGEPQGSLKAWSAAPGATRGRLRARRLLAVRPPRASWWRSTAPEASPGAPPPRLAACLARRLVLSRPALPHRVGARPPPQPGAPRFPGLLRPSPEACGLGRRRRRGGGERPVLSPRGVAPFGACVRPSAARWSLPGRCSCDVCEGRPPPGRSLALPPGPGGGARPGALGPGPGPPSRAGRARRPASVAFPLAVEWRAPPLRPRPPAGLGAGPRPGPGPRPEACAGAAAARARLSPGPGTAVRLSLAARTSGSPRGVGERRPRLAAARVRACAWSPTSSRLPGTDRAVRLLARGAREGWGSASPSRGLCALGGCACARVSGWGPACCAPPSRRATPRPRPIPPRSLARSALRLSPARQPPSRLRDAGPILARSPGLGRDLAALYLPG